MLSRMYSEHPSFKDAEFRPGLNIAVARRTREGQALDSTNAVGKTSFIKVLDFLLGGDARPNHVVRRPELSDYDYNLDLVAAGKNHQISRRGSDPPNPTFDGVGVKVSQLREELGRDLFGLTGAPGEPSFRSLIAFYVRDVASGAFENPIETHRKQSIASTQSQLAYLFGLDLDLVAESAQLAESEKNLRELRRAARDPVMGLTVGRPASLDAQIATAEQESRALSGQLENFVVVDRYAEHRRRADELSARIRRLNDDMVLTEKYIRELDDAMTQEADTQPDHIYLGSVYEQVGVTLGEAVTRRFEEVEQFHESVVRNRRLYLETERADQVEMLAGLRRELDSLDAERSRVMALLQAGGALETFQELQRQVGEVDGRLAELRQRRDVAERWENTSRHFGLRSAELSVRFGTEIEERRELRSQVAELFASFAYKLYGSQRPASLTIDSDKNSYTFIPTIGGDRSEGVRSLALFCFDLTLSVVAHRNGRGPDFLVHDSHLYDSVETRQVASALSIAQETAAAEGMQYIVALNSDVLDLALYENPGLEYNQCVTMTDEYEEGGLFGVRFN